MINPITCLDYPDVDMIRVENTYYMVSTTMYFMPGCEILRSYDLVHWEHCSYVYDTLDSTPAQRMEDGLNIYGNGMWAASLRYHNNTFYVCFVANDTHKTYLYTSKNIHGPWKKSTIDGFYHDNSILFDDDGKVYIVYGNKEIHITELSADMTAPKSGGLNKIILIDNDDVWLGYEGCHFYKINGRYYLFNIHIPKLTGRRTESCFIADKPEGPYIGGDIFDDTRGLANSGVAQGGIIDTPDGKWYAMLFQDSGAVGRMPILIPLSWKNNMPVLGIDNKVPEDFTTPVVHSDYTYRPLVGSDDFKYEEDPVFNNGTQPLFSEKYGSLGLKSCWEYNHEPALDLVKVDTANGTLTIQTGKVCTNLVQARNTLTQRCMYPYCSAEVTLDASGLNKGDYAGLCILQSNYAYVGVKKGTDSLNLITVKREVHNDFTKGLRNDTKPGEECTSIPLKTNIIRLRIDADFNQMNDTAILSYIDGNGVTHTLGSPVKLKFMLDHFTGARFGLFIFSTKKSGGKAVFSDFKYDTRVKNI